jgi:hypothetical protein
MARDAILQGVDLVFPHQSAPEFQLVRRWLVRDAENLIFGANIFLGLAVAIEAPAHLHLCSRPGDGHLPDGTMACGASNPFCDVNAVIEIDEFWESVNPRPLDRGVVPKASPDRLEHRTRLPYLRMAGHTGFSRWQSSKGRLLDRGVAIAAVNAKFVGVMAVAERNWLFAWNVLLCVIGRTVDQPRHETRGDDDDERSINAEARNEVRTVMKDLSHSPIVVAGDTESQLAWPKISYSFAVSVTSSRIS